MKRALNAKLNSGADREIGGFSAGVSQGKRVNFRFHRID